jgi:transposase
MRFIGIDLHTNKFTCCYREEDNSSAKAPSKTFNLTPQGLEEFYLTLTPQTYVLLEATITSFSFTRLFKDKVAQVFIANTYELKQISLARCKTDKIDADKLCRIIKMQVLSGESTISEVTVPPKDIQILRAFFYTYRLYKKQTTQLKNRIHSLVKENLHGFTQEEIFGSKNRQMIRQISDCPDLSFHLNLLMDSLEKLEKDIAALKDRILFYAQPYMKQIEILTSMKGVSVFIATAILADIIDVSRFKNSKTFTSYLRSAPQVSSSNTSPEYSGDEQEGKKTFGNALNAELKSCSCGQPKVAKVV